MERVGPAHHPRGRAVAFGSKKLPEAARGSHTHRCWLETEPDVPFGCATWRSHTSEPRCGRITAGPLQNGQYVCLDFMLSKVSKLGACG